MDRIQHFEYYSDDKGSKVVRNLRHRRFAGTSELFSGIFSSYMEDVSYDGDHNFVGSFWHLQHFLKKHNGDGK